MTFRKRKAALLIEMTVKRYSDENHVRSVCAINHVRNYVLNLFSNISSNWRQGTDVPGEDDDAEEDEDEEGESCEEEEEEGEEEEELR